ncbi:hypothetical protein GT358_01730 [Rubellimicrobium sp. CFH 75288]|nr:hypothetical protein [Rubellimicrobium sp. CFH 75288]
MNAPWPSGNPKGTREDGKWAKKIDVRTARPEPGRTAGRAEPYPGGMDKAWHNRGAKSNGK